VDIGGYDEAKRFADALAIQPEPTACDHKIRNSGFEDRLVMNS
jgi:hypothetical protein